MFRSEVKVHGPSISVLGYCLLRLLQPTFFPNSSASARFPVVRFRRLVEICLLRALNPVLKNILALWGPTYGQRPKCPLAAGTLPPVRCFDPVCQWPCLILSQRRSGRYPSPGAGPNWIEVRRTSLKNPWLLPCHHGRLDKKRTCHLCTRLGDPN
jgi:hypothetical protein